MLFVLEYFNSSSKSTNIVAAGSSEPPGRIFPGGLMGGCLDNTKLNHQEATFKLMADFVRETGKGNVAGVIASRKVRKGLGFRQDNVREG